MKHSALGFAAATDTLWARVYRSCRDFCRQGKLKLLPCFLRLFPPQRYGRQDSTSRSLSPPIYPSQHPRVPAGQCSALGMCYGACLHPQAHNVWQTTADVMPTSLAGAMPPPDVPAGDSPGDRGAGSTLVRLAAAQVEQSQNVWILHPTL